jgi:hypothetical protein
MRTLSFEFDVRRNSCNTVSTGKDIQVTEGEQMYISTPSLASAVDGGSVFNATTRPRHLTGKEPHDPES